MADERIIFFSYASQDRARVAPYFDQLLGRGHDVWMDYKKLKPGQNWDLEIQRALNRAALIIVFVSNNSVNKRGYVQREIKIALDKATEKLASDIYLIPVRLDDSAPLPEEMKHIQTVDAGDSNCIEKIDDAIRHQLQEARQSTSDLQGSSEVYWSTSNYSESWDGQPGYQAEFSLFSFSSAKYPKVGQITDIVRGGLLSDVLSYRSIKLSQDTETFSFGQESYLRTNTWEAFPSEPSIVGRVLSFHHSVHSYGAGAAHGNMHFQTHSFLLDPVISIESLASVVSDPDYALAAIQTLIQKQLLNPTDDLELPEYWVFEGTQNWEALRNFTFNESGLKFYFAPYQVGPYAAGPQFAEVPYQQCATLLVPWLRDALGVDFQIDKALDQGKHTSLAIETVAEFIDRISSQRTLLIANRALTITDGFPVSTQHVSWDDVFDGKEMIIRGAINLSLKGHSGTILAIPRYAWVLTFSHCRGTSLLDLTLGHTVTGTCQGGVIKFKNCEKVEIRDCDLFGSGTYGFEFEDCKSVRIEGTTVRDCSYGILSIKNCQDVKFIDCKFSRNREFDLCTFEGQAEQIMFQRCLFDGNFSRNAMFNLKSITEKGSVVYVWDCKFVENDCAAFQDESGFFSERGNEFLANVWRETDR
jgi:hypothetical protein